MKRAKSITKQRVNISLNGSLRKKDFYEFLEQYDPLEFEMMGDRPWATFSRPLNYTIRNRFRFFLVFKYEKLKLLLLLSS